jgi:uncharacterized membrane protein YbhN (UPF0104 family)
MLVGLLLLVQRISGAAGYFSVMGTRSIVLTTVSVVGIVLVATSYACVWSWIVARLSYQRGVLFSDVLVFAYSWLGRYVPGTVPYHATRVLMATRAGRSAEAATASIAYETLLQVSSLALVGTCSLVLAVGVKTGSNSSYFLLALALIPLPFVLKQSLLCLIANRVLRLAGRPALDREFFLSMKENLGLILAYASGHIINGLAFYLVVEALVPASGVSPVLAVAVFSLAGAVGIVAFIAPSGIGVREAVIVAVLGLSASLPAEGAIAVAALSRAVAVIADLAFVAVIFVFDSVLHLRFSDPLSITKVPDSAQEEQPELAA